MYGNLENNSVIEPSLDHWCVPIPLHTSLNQKYTTGQLNIVINRAYMSALSRDATREELKLGRRFIHTQSITICKDRVQVDPADDYEYTLPLPVTDTDRFQALVDLCHIILNLDDFMYVQ